MPPYDSIQAQDVLFMITVGLGIAASIALARGSRYLFFSFGKRTAEQEKPHEFGGNVTETNRPVPLFIWLVFVGFFVWATGYIIYSGWVSF